MLHIRLFTETPEQVNPPNFYGPEQPSRSLGDTLDLSTPCDVVCLAGNIGRCGHQLAAIPDCLELLGNWAFDLKVHASFERTSQSVGENAGAAAVAGRELMKETTYEFAFILGVDNWYAHVHFR